MHMCVCVCVHFKTIKGVLLPASGEEYYYCKSLYYPMKVREGEVKLHGNWSTPSQFSRSSVDDLSAGKGGACAVSSTLALLIQPSGCMLQLLAS